MHIYGVFVFNFSNLGIFCAKFMRFNIKLSNNFSNNLKN